MKSMKEDLEATANKVPFGRMNRRRDPLSSPLGWRSSAGGVGGSSGNRRQSSPTLLPMSTAEIQIGPAAAAVGRVNRRSKRC